jgi:hypothetical protein
LWAKTVEALEWAIAKRNSQTVVTGGTDLGKDISVRPDSYLILTKDGHPLVRRLQHRMTYRPILNKWDRLNRPIVKDYPDFRRLGFGAVRRTAANLVWEFGDRETVMAFLRYSDPARQLLFPFGKVFDALRRMEDHLRPVLRCRPNLRKVFDQ